MKATFEFDSIEEMQTFLFGEGVNNMAEEDTRSDEAAERKEQAAADEPTLRDPERATGTGADVGSRRAPDELAHTSVEEAARANAEPLDPETGVDGVRDPEGGETATDDEDE